MKRRVLNFSVESDSSLKKEEEDDDADSLLCELERFFGDCWEPKVLYFALCDEGDEGDEGGGSGLEGVDLKVEAELGFDDDDDDVSEIEAREPVDDPSSVPRESLLLEVDVERGVELDRAIFGKETALCSRERELVKVVEEEEEVVVDEGEEDGDLGSSGISISPLVVVCLLFCLFSFSLSFSFSVLVLVLLRDKDDSLSEFICNLWFDSSSWSVEEGVEVVEGEIEEVEVKMSPFSVVFVVIADTSLIIFTKQ